MRHIFLIFLLLPSLLCAQLFEDASNQLPDNGAKGQTMDVQAADIDGDGDLDIILANEFQANTILLNDGKANFSLAPAGTLPVKIADSEDVAVADYDGNGTLDLVFCSEDDINLSRTDVHEFYLNDGQGNFALTTFRLPDSEANAVIQADMNGDGLPDLLFGNNGPTGLLINNGDSTFSPDTSRIPQISRTTQDLGLADVDGDGDLDLFEANENGNLLFIQDSSGNFTNESNARLPQNSNIESRKVSFGDVDNDGDLDIFLSNVEFITGKDRHNKLWINDGKGFFTDRSRVQLPFDNDHTIDAIFEDVDLDGDLDIVVANVFGGNIKLYENDGSGRFFDATTAVLGQQFFRDALGVIAADLNGDGLRDLYICDRRMQQSNNKDLLLLRKAITSKLDEKDSHALIVFPNPVTDHINLICPKPAPDSLDIFDLHGKQLLSLPLNRLGRNQYQADIRKTGLGPGTYVVKVGDRQRVVTVR
ncbi:MAG: T9SS type A sorting domain-containing protein [Bacteroidia bacterium]